MAKDFQQTDTDAALSAGVACSGATGMASAHASSLATDGGTAGSTAETCTLNAPGEDDHVFYRVEIDPAEDVPSGDHIARINPTTTSNDFVLIEVHVCWWNGSSYSSLGSNTGLNLAMNATRTVTISGASASPTYSSGDRLLYAFVARTDRSHGNDSIAVTPDQLMTTPITTKVTFTMTAAAATSATNADFHVTRGLKATAAANASVVDNFGQVQSGFKLTRPFEITNLGGAAASTSTSAALGLVKPFTMTAAASTDVADNQLQADSGFKVTRGYTMTAAAVAMGPAVMPLDVVRGLKVSGGPTTTCFSDTAAALNQTRPFTLTAPGQAATAANLKQTRGLLQTVPGPIAQAAQPVIDAVLRITRRFRLTSAGAPSTVADINQTRGLTTTAAAASSTAGALDQTVRFTMTAAATTAADAALTNVVSFTMTAAATTATAADLTVAAAVTFTMTAAATTSATNADFHVTRGLTSTAGAASSTAGALDQTRGLKITTLGGANATTAADAALTNVVSFTMTAAATTTTAADLVVTGKVDFTMTAAATTDAADNDLQPTSGFKQTRGFTLPASGTVLVAAGLDLDRGLAATVAASTLTLADLLIEGAITGPYTVDDARTFVAGGEQRTYVAGGEQRTYTAGADPPDLRTHV